MAGIMPFTMAWALPYQSLILKTIYRIIYMPVLWRHFLSWGFLLDNSDLYLIDMQLSSTLSQTARNHEYFVFLIELHEHKTFVYIFQIFTFVDNFVLPDLILPMSQ